MPTSPLPTPKVLDDRHPRLSLVRVGDTGAHSRAPPLRFVESSHYRCGVGRALRVEVGDQPGRLLGVAGALARVSGERHLLSLRNLEYVKDEIAAHQLKRRYVSIHVNDGMPRPYNSEAPGFHRGIGIDQCPHTEHLLLHLNREYLSAAGHLYADDVRYRDRKLPNGHHAA
jgi:hypothetical protein